MARACVVWIYPHRVRELLHKRFPKLKVCIIARIEYQTFVLKRCKASDINPRRVCAEERSYPSLISLRVPGAFAFQ